MENITLETAETAETVKKRSNKVLRMAAAAVVAVVAFTAVLSFAFSASAEGEAGVVTEAAFASRTTNSVVITFSSEECTGYEIEYSKDALFDTAERVSAVYGAKSAEITNLESGTEYYIRVRAYTVENGEYIYGEYSQSIHNITVPKAPKLSFKSCNEGAIRFAFTNTECAGYELRYSKNSDMSSAKTVAVKATESEVRVSGLKAGTKYYGQVRAYTEFEGEKVYSAWSGKAKATTRPKAVSVSFKACNSEAIRVAYKQVACSGYQIKYSKNSDMSSPKYITASAASTEKRIANLAAGTTYYVKIRTYMKVGGKYYYSALSGKVKTTTKPAAAKVEEITAPASKAIKVKVKAQKRTGYQLQYSKNSKFSSKKSISQSKSKTFNIKGLKSATTYYVRVRAYKTVNGEKYYGSWSSTKKIKVYETKKILTATKMQKSAKWASSAVETLNKNDTVRVLGKSGRWYKVKYGNEAGYVYNLAFKQAGAQNLSRSGVTSANYKTYLDDIIFRYGSDKYTLYSYVAYNMSYSYSKISVAQRRANINSASRVKRNEGELTAVAIRQRGGICYNYAAFTKTLLERAGYNVRYVYGKNKNGSHCWVMIKTSSGYRHIDAVRKAYQYTDRRMRSSSKTSDFTWSSSYPRCV